MKKLSLLLVNAALICMLASCGGDFDSDSGDGRANSLAPDEKGATSYTIDNGCGKLSKALKAMPSQKSLSFALDGESTISSSGTVSKTYNENAASSDSGAYTDSATTYSLDVVNPTFEGALTGLSGTSIADVKANVALGGDISMKMKQDEETEKTLKVLGATLKAYMDEENYYVDPRECKDLITKGITTFVTDGSLFANIVGKKLNTGYYLKHNLTDENMPLLKDDTFSNVDEYLSLFSDHAEDYKDFISVFGKDSTFTFYVSMNKEDLIEVLTDAQSKAKEESKLDTEDIDFAAQLADSTVNALEFLVTFTEKAVLSVDFNIDMEVVNTEDITKKDSDGNESKIGVSKSVTNDKATGKLTFGQEEASIPASVKDFSDGAELISSIRKLIEGLLSNMGDLDIDFGDFDFGDFDFGGLIK